MDSETFLIQKRELTQLIRKLSYREGDFTLASGKKSKFYVDLKATTLHPRGAWKIAETAVSWIQQKGWHFGGVGGLTLGADPLATAVSMVAERAGFFWPAYLVRKQPKGHGTGRYIEGIEHLRPGVPLLVLEDVVTTGGSSVFAIERLRDAGFHPFAVLAVVDRESGGREAFEKCGVQFAALTTLKEIQLMS